MSNASASCRPTLQVTPYRSCNEESVADRQRPAVGMPGHIFKASVATATQCATPTCEFPGGSDGGAAHGQGKASLSDRLVKLQMLTQHAQFDAWPEGIMAIRKP
jgi:hypothetical protein